jgi:outer membrane protein OmpA-like peptidoglycan-associated protein
MIPVSSKPFSKITVMKSLQFLFCAFCLVQLPLHAQVKASGKEEVVVVRPAVVVLDAKEVRRQLSIPPKVVVLPVPAPAPTAKTTTIVTSPGAASRVYNADRNVVVVVTQNQSMEMPYVTLPVLFEKETANLLDKESRSALDQVAAVIHEVSKTGKGAMFDIEGHTSTEGTEDFNLKLSADRARRVFEELTQHYGVPASVLSAHGYGENFPQHPKGSEKEKQLDRRVLVVRTK